MEKTANLIITDSYFNIFSLLAQEIKGKPRDIACKNLVFCEDKISLMAERQTENTMSTLLVEQAHSQYCIDFLMAKLVRKKRTNLNSSSFVKILISL